MFLHIDLWFLFPWYVTQNIGSDVVLISHINVLTLEAIVVQLFRPTLMTLFVFAFFLPFHSLTEMSVWQASSINLLFVEIQGIVAKHILTKLTGYHDVTFELLD